MNFFHIITLFNILKIKVLYHLILLFLLDKNKIFHANKKV